MTSSAKRPWLLIERQILGDAAAAGSPTHRANVQWRAESGAGSHDRVVLAALATRVDIARYEVSEKVLGQVAAQKDSSSLLMRTVTIRARAPDATKSR